MKITTLAQWGAAAFCLFTLSTQAQPWTENSSPYTTRNFGIGMTAAPTATSPIRLEVIKSASGSYTAVFRSATTNDSYLYHVISPSYHLIGSSKNNTGMLRKLGFAVGTADGEGDIKMTIDVTGNVGFGNLSPTARIDVVKPTTGAYTAIFRDSSPGNDSYLYHRVTPGYQLIGSSKNGTGAVRSIGFALGTADGEEDIKMVIDQEGKVGIGTRSTDAKLTVNGDIHAKEVRIDVNVPAPDYVFEANYELMPLSVLAKYLKENKHLPEVPAGKELEEKGVNVSEMNMLLLKKVEELTLYMLELKKENDELKQRVEILEDTTR